MHTTDNMADRRRHIVIADDFPEMLETVERRLAPQFEIVGKVADGLALIECACRLQPDLLLIDVSMPKLNGIEALRRLRSLGVQIPAIILTNHDDEDVATEALSAGSQGFVVKSHLGTDLSLAIAEVLAGRTFISRALREKLSKKEEQKRAEGESQFDVHAIEVLLDHSGLMIKRTETAVWQAGRAPGCWAKTLFVEKESDISTSLIRMDPGTRFPRHRHAGTEEVFLLEGDLVVEGEKMKPGDYCRAEIGSTHAESYTDSGCVFLLKASQLDELFE
jgi:DNA-binding NarL/FixJ family response regulator/quercetin dioxygenase-like cupin family protein